MNHNQIVVVKVGGSLLKSRDLAERLRDWLAARSGERPQVHLVFVVGGGPWADRVRELDTHSAIGIERAHWACIEIMDVTAGLLAAMLPDLSVVTSFDDLQRRVEVPGTTIFKPGEFMLRFEPNSPGTKLPASWDVTSDSIARASRSCSMPTNSCCSSLPCRPRAATRADFWPIGRLLVTSTRSCPV